MCSTCICCCDTTTGQESRYLQRGYSLSAVKCFRIMICCSCTPVHAHGCQCMQQGGCLHPPAYCLSLQVQATLRMQYIQEFYQVSVVVSSNDAAGSGWSCACTTNRQQQRHQHDHHFSPHQADTTAQCPCSHLIRTKTHTLTHSNSCTHTTVCMCCCRCGNMQQQGLAMRWF